MENAPARQRGPPPADERSSSRHSPPPPRQPWAHRDGDRPDRLPLRARAPLDDDRYYPRGPASNGAGPSSSMNSSGVGPSGAPRSNGGQGPYRRFPQQSRTRSQSPPGSSTYSSAPYSGPSRRFEQSSPPKRAWGAASRDSRDLPPPSTLDIPPYDRDGPYRGQRGGPWSERRPNGIVGPPSSAYQHDRFPRSERDARGRTEDQPDRRPLDNGWPRYNKSHSDSNGWKDDKGKGPAYDFDDRRASFSRNNQNNPPSSLNGSRGRSPDSVRSRERRSPSFDDFPLRSPASSTHSQSRLSDRLAADYDRPPPHRGYQHPRLSAPPSQAQHPPLNRSSSAGQPALLRRDIDLPPDRPPDALEHRLGRSASVSQGNLPHLNNGAWPSRRRSLSASPPQEVEVSKTHSSPKSLAERLGPLASIASKGLQDRIEPVVFRSRTPPPRSPVRQSAPSTLQRSRSPIPTEAAVAPPVARSFTPPLPSPAHRTANRLNEVAVASTKDASPSPKLASSPSEAAQSSPRPSTTDLEQATSEVTQARTSPDISKEDENMLGDGTEEARETEPAIGLGDAAIAQASQPSSNDGTIAQKTVYSALDSASAKSDSLPSVVEAPPAAIIQEAPDYVEAGHSPMLEKEAQLDEQHIRVEVEATLTKVETEDVDMEANVSSLESQAIVPAAQDVSNTSIVVKEGQMEVDEQQQRPLSVTDEPSFSKDAQTDREATEEDPVATEFEKSLISFIETTEPDEDDNSVDLSNILEDNKLKAPISLPLAVSMPDEDQDVFEIQPLLLENHDLLDGWLRETMASRDKRRGEKIFRLRQQYKELDNEWQVHCNKLEKIRERQKRRQNMPIIPPTPSVDSAGISFMPTTPNLLAPSGRSNRRSAASSIGYGDAVRSEAEFLEILASLEDADMRDPNLRAMRTTAAVPDQIIDESEYTLQQYDDNNGLVTDPFEHYGINKTPDSWTEEEIAIFCRRYALYPKQFGKIAAALPDKSTNQCVLFYYRSKKKIDFRALVDRRNRDGRRKRSKGDKSDAKKGPSLLNNIERARGGEAEEDEDEEPQTPGSAMAQESTVMSTARALTQQINGFANGSARTEPVKRPLAGRSVSGKKATRFLSPSEDRSGNGTDDGVPPPSDGALAAAEALGFLSAIPSGDPNDPTAQPSNAKQKKRKPSMSESTLNTSLGEDGTPRPVNVAKRSRPHSSSYWSVADKNEFIRLLSVHGKNYVAIAEGIQSKTAVQCKNFFQNNTKKMNLAEIAAKAEGEFGNTSGEFGEDLAENKLETPSVFGEPGGAMPQEPTSGYFIPSHATNRDADEHKPSARSGGMHLRNLLDDAPDAEGGAHAHPHPDVRLAGDDDSATEDEAEPARYAQGTVDARGALRQAHAERTASQQRHASRVVKEEMISVDSALQRSAAAERGYYQPHMRSSSYGSRAEYPTEQDQYSPTYHPLQHDGRGYSVPPRHAYPSGVNGHYENSLPQSGHWSPYEGRSIYGPPARSDYFPRSRQGEQAPLGYHRHEHHAYMDSPVYEKSVHRATYSSHPHQHSPPHYNGSGRSPPHQPPQPVRHYSDPSAPPHAESPYYEHYGYPRAT